ncbi:MAG: hypothetical protein BRD31_06755 [Bacteroidetes bacterium QH_2_64_26]|nr:MAG: hypothetical protein BRD31_06755 [Bacteroidetes bacterium QH_2_64_26]
MPSTDAQLDLTIDDAAAAYAREQGGVLTLRTRARHGCCGGHVHRSFVSLGDEAMHVGLDRLWIWNSLYVEAAARM